MVALFGYSVTLFTKTQTEYCLARDKFKQVWYNILCGLNAKIEMIKINGPAADVNGARLYKYEDGLQ